MASLDPVVFSVRAVEPHRHRPRRSSSPWARNSGQADTLVAAHEQRAADAHRAPLLSEPAVLSENPASSAATRALDLCTAHRVRLHRSRRNVPCTASAAHRKTVLTASSTCACRSTRGGPACGRPRRARQLPPRGASSLEAWLALLGGADAMPFGGGAGTHAPSIRALLHRPRMGRTAPGSGRGALAPALGRISAASSAVVCHSQSVDEKP